MLGFANGFSAQYTGTLSNGSSTEPTGNAEQSGADDGPTFSGVFQAPESWSPRVTSPITASLTFRQTGQKNCRFQSGFSGGLADECVPFIDFRNRTANLVVETTVSELRVGLQ